MEIFSILLRSFGEKDTEKILKIIGILFQYFFNISVPSIVQCIQCHTTKTQDCNFRPTNRRSPQAQFNELEQARTSRGMRSHTNTSVHTLLPSWNCSTPPANPTTEQTTHNGSVGQKRWDVARGKKRQFVVLHEGTSRCRLAEGERHERHDAADECDFIERRNDGPPLRRSSIKDGWSVGEGGDVAYGQGRVRRALMAQ